MRIQALGAMASIAYADGEAIVGADKFWFVAVSLQLRDVELQLLIAVVGKWSGSGLRDSEQRR